MYTNDRAIAEFEALQAIYPESFERVENVFRRRFTVNLTSENGLCFSLDFSLPLEYSLRKPSVDFSCPNLTKTHERGIQEKISRFIDKQSEDYEMLFEICQFVQELDFPLSSKPDLKVLQGESRAERSEIRFWVFNHLLKGKAHVKEKTLVSTLKVSSLPVIFFYGTPGLVSASGTSSSLDALMRGMRASGKRPRLAASLTNLPAPWPSGISKFDHLQPSEKIDEVKLSSFLKPLNLSLTEILHARGSSGAGETEMDIFEIEVKTHNGPYAGTKAQCTITLVGGNACKPGALRKSQALELPTPLQPNETISITESLPVFLLPLVQVELINPSSDSWRCQWVKIRAQGQESFIHSMHWVSKNKPARAFVRGSKWEHPDSKIVFKE